MILVAAPWENIYGGNHTIMLVFDDSITTPVSIEFNFEIIYNWPLVSISSVSDRMAIVNNWFTYNFNMSKLFRNPEKNPFFIYVRQSDSGNTLPYFIY